MLVTGSVNKVSKIHERSSGDVSPFQYEYAKLDANVCGSGMNAELRMTCRSRSFHFRAATALHTSERSVKRLRGRVERLSWTRVEQEKGKVNYVPQPVVVEMTTTLGHDVWVGDAAKIRASDSRQQKHDKTI